MPIDPFVLTAASVHLCIDMQRLFSSDGPWPTPWMERILPVVAEIASRHPRRTIFTRFVPPRRVEDARGAWQRYYRRWPDVTLNRLDHRLVELMPPLQALVPPARVFDKPVYSAFAGRRLREHLSSRGADTLVLTGGETDVCVLATVLGAIDHGFPVVVVSDALCSSSDEGHDSLVALYATRFSEQVRTATAEEVLRSWT